VKTIRRIFFLLTLVALPQVAFALILHLHMSRQECANAVADILAPVIFGASATADVGTFHALRAYLHRAGVDSNEAETLVQGISWVLHTTEERIDDLGDVSRTLRQNIRSEDRLMVCIAGKDSSLVAGAEALHVSTKDHFDIVAFERGPHQEEFRLDFDSDNRNLPSFEPHVLIFKTSNFSGGMSLFYVFHEVAHMADVDLLDEWQSANSRLFDEGQAVDELFQQFSRRENGRLKIDLGFVRTFLEGHANLVETKLYNLLVSAGRIPADFRQVQNFLTHKRAVAIEALEKEKSTEYIRELYRISDNNIFEVVSAWRQTMRGTISKINSPLYLKAAHTR
jgi:hypothetical protein